ncbi:MAG: phosphopantetheine-binding protein [Dehalococcoidia bacterium]
MSTLDQLKKMIAKVTHGTEGDIALNTPLKDIKADSLHWVQIIIAVEGAFNVEVDVDAMRNFVTIGDFVQYIEKAGK